MSDCAPELVWLLEHPPLYTAGTSADPAELFNPQGFPVYEAGRGGRYTYHGPGQRVGYLLLDLNRRGRDVRQFVHALEGWLIESAGTNSASRPFAREGADRHLGEARGTPRRRSARSASSAPLGHHARLFVNVDPELSHFSGIVPCGIAEFPVTSLDEMGVSPRAGTFRSGTEGGGFGQFLLSLEGRNREGLRPPSFRLMCKTDLVEKGPDPTKSSI
jgi:lipoyl(octanoyl) transferase